MNATQRVVHAEALRAALKKLGWVENRHKHLTTKFAPSGDQLRVYRIKFQATSIRLEVQGLPTSLPAGMDNRKPWYRVSGGFIKDCAILDDGRVRVGGFIFNPLNEQK